MTRFRSAFAVPSGFAVASRPETGARIALDSTTRPAKPVASGQRRTQPKAAADKAA